MLTTIKRRVRYGGSAVHCPVCEHDWRRFAEHRGRAGAKCPGCGSLERQRKLWLLLPERVQAGQRVLHVAPEPALQAHLKSMPIEHISIDLQSPHADLHGDICALPFEADSFDVVICNHVLEHVPDDRLAMRELRRVLRAGGLAILQHPVHDRPDTYEDPSVVTPEDRLRIFGQEDHVRIYGRDFVDRLADAGFSAEYYEPDDLFSASDVARFGLGRSSTVLAT